MKKIKLYFLIESSDSMKGARIGTVNAAIEESVPMLRKIEEDLNAQIYVQVMSYGSWARWHSEKSVSLYDFIWNDIKASGSAEFGAALNLLGAEMWGNDPTAFTVIINMASTNPTDDYESVLKKIEQLDAYAKAMKLCIRIEDGLDREIAYRFTGSFSRVFSATDHFMLKHLIESGAEDFFHDCVNNEDIRIEDLGLSIRAINNLKRAGINTVGDLVRPREEMMGVRNLGRKSLEEVLDKLKELGIKLTTEDDLIYTEKNHPGRDKCDQLRDIRKKIAEANGIDFEPAECHHTGPCRGTCPVCDSEIRYIDEQLQKKKERGEEIVLTGIAEVDIRKSKVSLPENDDDVDITMGAPAPIIDGGIDTIDLDLGQSSDDSGNNDWGW